jgi:hypothetical protein
VQVYSIKYEKIGSEVKVKGAEGLNFEDKLVA